MSKYKFFAIALVFLFLAIAPLKVLATSDYDGDGTPDNLDNCPAQPGPPENLGCPYPDSDGDGTTDNIDNCPAQAGPASNLGCPYDLDGDGIIDTQDACPNQKGPASNAGCPVTTPTNNTGSGSSTSSGSTSSNTNKDTDKDGVIDSKDKCDTKAGPSSNNGCPLTDTDKDGTTDAKDKCPTEAGLAKNNGCPDLVVKIVKDELVESDSSKAIVYINVSRTGEKLYIYNNSVEVYEVVPDKNDIAFRIDLNVGKNDIKVATTSDVTKSVDGVSIERKEARNNLICIILALFALLIAIAIFIVLKRRRKQIKENV